MSSMLKKQERLDNFTDQLLNLLQTQLADRSRHAPRSFGFEIEFLPVEPMTAETLAGIQDILPEIGFYSLSDRWEHESGLFITFEPGGQIEFCSPPLLAHETERLDDLLKLICDSLIDIRRRTGVDFVAQGYLPGRDTAPMLLTSERYRRMHERMAYTGQRGRDMMKGTASIHLHVGFNHLEELPLLFQSLCELSQTMTFGMSDVRRKIWNSTDPSRCGLIPMKWDESLSPRDFLRGIVDTALKAEDLYTDRPAYELEELSFRDFLVHLTTLFTDVRLNLKGPSVELRTPDSLPLDWFGEKWDRFVQLFDHQQESPCHHCTSSRAIR